jgi:hypothetical protein
MQPVAGALKIVPKADPSLRLVTCELEGCEQQIPIGESFSTAPAGLMTTGPVHMPAFICSEAEQHFACCMDHAVQVHLLCLRDHVLAKHAAYTAFAMQQREGASSDANTSRTAAAE